MSRILRSMTYRLLHTKVFWLIMILLIAAEVGLFFLGGTPELNSNIFANHHEFIVHDHESGRDQTVYVEYEKEDPLIVSKYTQNIMMGDFMFVPGQVYKSELSLVNLATVNLLLSICLMLLLAADAIFVITFFGEMFSDDAIRNMVTVKTRKEKVFLSSLIINAAVCIAMFILVFGILAVCTLLSGYYPIIHVPSFVSAVLTGLLVIIAANSFFIFTLFIVQNSLLTFVFGLLLFFLSAMNFMLGTSGLCFTQKYKTDTEMSEYFFKGGYKIEGEGEWYLPVDRFRIGRAYYPEEDRTIDFLSDVPNEDYPGDRAIMVFQTFYRLDLFHYPFEMKLFFIYPMYRDGLITRYVVVSLCYLVLLTTGGCYVVRKRNVN